MEKTITEIIDRRPTTATLITVERAQRGATRGGDTRALTFPGSLA